MFCYIILFYFNPPKSIGGMEGEGQNKFDNDSEFSGGNQRNGEVQVCFATLFCFISILQNLSEEWRERDRINLTLFRFSLSFTFQSRRF